MAASETREHRIQRLMYEQNVGRATAERVADEHDDFIAKAVEELKELQAFMDHLGVSEMTEPQFLRWLALSSLVAREVGTENGERS
jgi:hypothetical protein